MLNDDAFGLQFVLAISLLPSKQTVHFVDNLGHYPLIPLSCMKAFVYQRGSVTYFSVTMNSQKCICFNGIVKIMVLFCLQ